MSAFLSIWAEVRSGGDGKWSMGQIDKNAAPREVTFKNADGSVSATPAGSGWAFRSIPAECTIPLLPHCTAFCASRKLPALHSSTCTLPAAPSSRATPIAAAAAQRSAAAG